MTWGRKTGGKDWKPGRESPNPSGRPRLPDDLRAIENITQDELRKLLSLYLRMDRATLQERIKDPTTPLVECFVGSIIHKGILGGDPTRLDFILNRTIGKVKEIMDLNVHRPVVISRPFTDEGDVILGTQKDLEDMNNG